MPAKKRKKKATGIKLGRKSAGKARTQLLKERLDAHAAGKRRYKWEL